jgi:hypothetical protein
MANVDKILENLDNYNTFINRQVTRANELLEANRLDTHENRRFFYEKRVSAVESKHREIVDVKQKIEQAKNKLNNIEMSLNDLLRIMDETIADLNNSKVSTLETMTRDRLKQSDVTLDPSLAKEDKWTELLKQKEEGKDYLGGKNKNKSKSKKTKITKKSEKKSKKMRKH